MYGRVRAMLNAGGFFGDNRDKFWAECASTAAKLDDILAYESGTPISFFDDGKEPGYADHLHPFGELAVVAKGGKKKIKAKLENRGDINFFAGYAENHSADVFRMFNVKTFRQTETKNFDFLGKMFEEIYDKEIFGVRRAEGEMRGN